MIDKKIIRTIIILSIIKRFEKIIGGRRESVQYALSSKQTRNPIKGKDDLERAIHDYLIFRKCKIQSLSVP